jgi:hypothetical protein
MVDFYGVSLFLLFLAVSEIGEHLPFICTYEESNGAISFLTKSKYRSYGLLKKVNFEGFCDVNVFWRSEGIYPSIIKGCEHSGVKIRLISIALSHPLLALQPIIRLRTILAKTTNARILKHQGKQ